MFFLHLQKKIVVRLFLILLFLYPLLSFAQSSKRSDSLLVYTFTIDNPDSLLVVDTSINNQHRYLDELKSKNSIFVSSANIGHPSRNIVFHVPSSVGFVYRNESLNNFLVTPKEILFYKNEKPFTLLSYTNSLKKEQDFSVIHSRKIGKYFSFNIDYNLFYSPGYYIHEQINHSKFYAASQYNTKNNKYGFFASVYACKNKLNENGGIDTSSEYLEDVFLKSAKSIVKSSGASVTNYVNFFKIPSNDTTQLSMYRLVFSLKSDYDRYSSTFEDEAPFDFYSDSFIDTLSTFDSIYNSSISNEFSIKNAGKDPLLLFSLGVKHKYIFFRDSVRSDENHQLITSFKLSTNNKKRFIAGAKAEVINQYYNSGDFFGIFELKYSFAKKNKNVHFLNLSISESSIHPDFLYTHMFSNHLIWDKTLEAIKTNDIGLKYYYKNIGLELNKYSILNYTFLNQLVSPTQLSSNLDVLSARLLTSIQNKWIGTDGVIAYQNSTNSALNLPEFCLKQSLFFKFNLVNKLLRIQAGVDFQYIQDYFADGYTPIIHAYYNQNIISMGDVFSYDAFMNIALKRARFFITAQNLNYLINSDYIYLAPNYPMNPFILKFGLNWRFHD